MLGNTNSAVGEARSWSVTPLLTLVSIENVAVRTSPSSDRPTDVKSFWEILGDSVVVPESLSLMFLPFGDPLVPLVSLLHVSLSVCLGKAYTGAGTLSTERVFLRMLRGSDERLSCLESSE